MSKFGRHRPGGAVFLPLVVAALVAAGILADEPVAAPASSLPPGFTTTAVFSGLTLPTAMAFSPDGKVYVAQKNGIVKVFPSVAAGTGSVFKNLSARTFNNYDRGMLGLAVDPRLGDGSGHDFVYVLYAKDAPPGQTPPVWNDTCPTTPGSNTDGCVVSGTLSRIPVNADGTAGAEQVLIDDEWCQQFSSHSVGHLAFGADGDLYVSGGEGGSYQNPDWGQFGGSLPGTPTPVNPCGDPPGGVGIANAIPTARGGSLRAQSPRRPAGERRLLSGTVLRVDPDTGAGVPGNPMYDAAAPAANGSRILAFGLRNPYRFVLRPGTDEVWVGDVGSSGWEEIDRIPTHAPAKAVNFGWPCYENTGARGSFAGLDLCASLASDSANPRTAPYWAYPHDAAMNGNDSCDYANGASISALAFATEANYPAGYRGALFFGDYTRNCLWVMSAGADGQPDPSTARTFIDDADTPFPVDIEVDPVSGDLFFVNIAMGTVSRISYASTNRAPTAAAAASPTAGNAPLAVHLDATGSSDPDGDALTYSWDTDGNGTFGDATGVTPTATYATGGTFAARVLVTDPGGLSVTSAPVPITVTAVAAPVNSAAPVVSGAAVVGGALSTTTGSWTGTGPITFERQWQRCSDPTTCTDIDGATAAGYTAQLADEDAWLRVRVTAANGGGRATAGSALVGPVAGATNAPPVPVIDGPAGTTRWKAGQTISFSGHATDAQDGTEPPARLTWSMVLGHCSATGCHQHPVATVPAATGGSFAAPDHGAPAYLEFTLTATDAVGATASVTRRVDAKAVALTFECTPSGAPLTVGDTELTVTPFTQSWVANSNVQVVAPDRFTTGASSYLFTGWSDGGPAAHILKAPTKDATIRATYGVESSGYVVDGFGGLHSLGGAPRATGGPSWFGWDIARGVARRAGGGGLVLDGFGGLHRFASGGARSPAASGGPYWSGWDIARGVAILPDGTGGYVLDGFGGLHPFGIGNRARPPEAKVSGYWAGWDIARGVTLNPDGSGGYVVDGFGGLHPFSVGSGPKPPAPTATPRWPGRDIVRGVSASRDGLGGYVLDGFGGISRYAVSASPAPLSGPTWPGWDIARGIGT